MARQSRQNDPETTREEAVNTHLAQLLADHGIPAKAERRSRQGVPDVRASLRGDDLVLLECKYEGSAGLLRDQLGHRLEAFPEALGMFGVLYPEYTDRGLRGRDAGMPESSAGVSVFAGRCRSEQARLGGTEGAGAGERGACAGMLARGSDPGRRCERRQAGSGSARNRASAAAHWPAQGQRLGRCRVQRRAEWVSRPARAK